MKYSILFVFLLSGCANYSYEKTEVDGSSCKVETRSSREVESAFLYVGENCEMASSASGLTENQSQQFGKLIDKLPSAGVGK